jgi:hypothetical protein
MNFTILWSPFANSEYEKFRIDYPNIPRKTKFHFDKMKNIIEKYNDGKWISELKKNPTITEVEDFLLLKLGTNIKKWFLMKDLGRLPFELSEYILPILPIEVTLLHSNHICDYLKCIAKLKPRTKVLDVIYENDPTPILNEIKIKDYDYYAFFFNTEKGIKSRGSHWVGFFIDLKNNRIEYFDSLGLLIPRAKILIQATADYLQDIIPNIEKKCFYICTFLQYKILNPDKTLQEFKKTVKLDPLSIAQRKNEFFNLVSSNLSDDKETYNLLLNAF